jgi:hypothetical protein
MPNYLHEDGIMEYWNDGMLVCSMKMFGISKTIIPPFQYSNIPQG